MVKYLKGQNAFTDDLEVEINVDSDCEDDSTETTDGALKEEKKEDNRAVLTAGSFSAYVRFLAS